MARPFGSGNLGHRTQFEIAAGGIKLAIDWDEVDRLWRMFPGSVAYEMRDAFGRIAGRMRKTMLEVHADTPMEDLVNRSLFYNVNPPNLRRSKGQDYAAVRALAGKLKLESINFRIYGTSKVLGVQERGGTITGRMLVPVGVVRAAMERAPAGRVRHTYRMYLGAAKVAKREINDVVYGAYGARGPNQMLTPLFVWKSQVTLRPRLRFYETWRGMARRFRGYVEQALDRAAVNSQRWIKEGVRA